MPLHILLLSLILFVCSSASPLFAQIIQDAKIDQSTFSPDGDGMEDSTIIRYTLSDSAFAVTMIVMTGDTLNVIDTLIGSVPKSAGLDSTSWKGTDSTGIIVSEGGYLIFLRAENASGVDSVYLDVIVDLTPTQVQITAIEPSTLFAPGVQGYFGYARRIEFNVWDVYPTERVVVQAFIYDPNYDPGDDPIDTLIDTLLVPDSSYEVTWDGTSATDDGFHEIRITASDDGGHSDTDFQAINVDKSAPAIGITIPEDGGYRVVPDSVRGWAYDRNGIRLDSLEIRYAEDSPFLDVPAKSLVNDTVFFSAPLADSIIEEREYKLSVRAFDTVGRSKIRNITVTLDTTPPDPPVLTSPAGVTHFPDYVLTGSFERQNTDIIRIFVNESIIDSIFKNLVPQDNSFSIEVPLMPGSNVLTAVAVDETGNASSPSNALSVFFDASAGLMIPNPFRPNDRFQVNLAREPVRVSLKLYDIGGDLVVSADDRSSSPNVTFDWNGENGDGEAVKRGPLVAVVVAEYADGTQCVFREIFLFEPQE